MAKDVRAILKIQYDRGFEAGRKQGFTEGVAQANRQAMLTLQAETLEAAARRVEDEPATTGLNEAAAILRDLADSGPVEPAPAGDDPAEEQGEDG